MGVVVTIRTKWSWRLRTSTNTHLAAGTSAPQQQIRAKYSHG